MKISTDQVARIFRTFSIGDLVIFDDQYSTEAPERGWIVFVNKEHDYVTVKWDKGDKQNYNFGAVDIEIRAGYWTHYPVKEAK